MYKSDVFLIKRSAHEILVEAYKQCGVDKNSPLQIRCYNFNNEHFGKLFSAEEFNKCRAYLVDANAINITSTPNMINLTSKGIEIAEEMIFNSISSPERPKVQEPYKPNSVRIEGRDLQSLFKGAT